MPGPQRNYDYETPPESDDALHAVNFRHPGDEGFANRPDNAPAHPQGGNANLHETVDRMGGPNIAGHGWFSGIVRNGREPKDVSAYGDEKTVYQDQDRAQNFRPVSPGGFKATTLALPLNSGSIWQPFLLIPERLSRAYVILSAEANVYIADSREAFMNSGAVGSNQYPPNAFLLQYGNNGFMLHTSSAIWVARKPQDAGSAVYSVSAMEEFYEASSLF